MAILPTNPREQKLLGVAIVALALAVAYWQLVWTPKAATLTTMEVKIDTLESQNKLAKIEVDKGNAAKMKREAAAYTTELSVLQHLVPTANEVPALVESISSAARRAGLELSDVQPDGVVNGDQFDTYRYKLGVTGPFNRVGEFLSNIATLPRIVEPINLLLTPSSRVGEIKAKKNEQLLDAHFQVQTYVSHASINTGNTGKPVKAGAP